MNLFKQNSPQTITSVLEKYFLLKNETMGLEPISELIKMLEKNDLKELIKVLKTNENICQNLTYYIQNLFKGRRFNLSLTEANILSEGSFSSEFKKRLLAKILPQVEDENTVSYLIANTFYRDKADFKFINKIPKEDSSELLRLLKIDHFVAQPKVKRELLLSMSILIWRIIGNVMEQEVLKMVPEYKNLGNPFLALEKELDYLVNIYKTEKNIEFNSKNSHYKQIRVYLKQCNEFVDKAFKNTEKYGISSKINQNLIKTKQQLQRFSEILNILVIDCDADYLEKSKLLIVSILNYKSKRNNLTELVNDSSTLMSHLITSHTAETGSTYITTSVKEYFIMLKKASGGGMIVGALCVLKMLYSYFPTSDFMHAVLYSFNYAMGFVMIYLMNFTLATKQPAMTAATMAKVLSDKKNTKKNHLDFAHLVSKLFRSQFIAFVGNVLWAFPVSLAIIYGLEILFAQNFAFEKSTKLLKDLNPFESKALLHASIAGVFLFISGIISGNVSNSSVFYQIPLRIAKSPRIKNIFGEKFAENLSKYYAKNYAGIISNAWFGTFLGATYPIGVFLGLDLDIRHITFAAGNLALGLYGKNFNVDSYTFWISFVTVFLIGFFNFIVSFGLSMFLAFRSRKVTFGDIGKINMEIVRYFFRNPLIFFFPIKSDLDERAKDLMK